MLKEKIIANKGKKSFKANILPIRRVNKKKSTYPSKF
jgi:hypothetical protein